MRKSKRIGEKWNPNRPEIHVASDPECDCWPYRPEGRAGIEAGLEDCRAGRVYRASLSDFEALMDGTMTPHDFSLRESLAAFELASPRETGATP